MLITRCPECATAFRCYPEQLDQARGWVRCGRCSSVFEAVRHTWPPSVSQAGDPSVVTVDAPSTVEPSVGGWADLATTLEQDRRGADDRLGGAPSRWSQWGLRVTLLFLALLLPAQWLMSQKDLLAAQSSMWRGWWSEGCGWLGCEVNWPREPQALRIESLRLEPGATGRYELQLQIRNGASYPLAAPWMELSLLGLRDDVLVRRAVSPQDLGLDTPVLALREANATLQFQLPDDVAPQVTGYKAILFYP